MKILWLTNTIISIVAETIGTKVSLNTGWTDLLSRRLLDDKNELICLYPDNSQKKAIFGQKGKLKWYGFYAPKAPSMNYNKKRYDYFKSILSSEKPDIVHIWGTEYSHSAEMAEAAKDIAPAVISIQGLISEIAKVYTYGLPDHVVNGTTFHDFVRRDNLRDQKCRFEKRGELEIRAIKSVHHVIGRTGWDRENVRRINPDAQYHKCEEIMREDFYGGEKWSYDKCEKHSIFMAQAYYPIKGMHIALEILRSLKKDFPDVHLYTTGRDARIRSFRDRLRQNTYEKYISGLIEEYGLNENVTYLGSLSAEKMKERYLKANVVLQASVIENSPNSLVEAMLTGTPVVASDVGGTNNVLGPYAKDCSFSILQHCKAIDMIRSVFDNDDLNRHVLYSSVREYVLERNDTHKVVTQYRNCYLNILN